MDRADVCNKTPQLAHYFGITLVLLPLSTSIEP
jgi:hypothetical protein